MWEISALTTPPFCCVGRYGALSLFHMLLKCSGGNISLARSFGCVCGIGWCLSVFLALNVFHTFQTFCVTIASSCGQFPGQFVVYNCAILNS